MSGYVDMFFTHFLDYMNKIFENEFMQYFLAIFVVIAVLGLLRKLLRVNK